MNVGPQPGSSARRRASQTACGVRMSISGNRGSQPSADDLFRDLELSGSSYTWRHFVRALTTGPIALRLSMVDALLSLLACAMYVAETYVEDEDDPILPIFDVTELGMAVFFALDYILHALDSAPPSAFIFSWASLLDLVTIVPVFVQLAYSRGAMARFAFIRFLRVLRVFRILRVHRTFEFTNSPVKQQTLKIGLTIVSIIFISAGVFHLTENLAYYDETDDEDDGLSFHRALYFTVVTIATVGYGDVAPQSDWGVFVVMATICVAFILLPMETQELRNIMAMNSLYAKATFRKRAKSQQLLVCGDANNDSLRGFLLEVLHEDHGDVAVDVVLLISEDPSPEMVHILTDNQFSDTLWYLAGSPMIERDLRRASAHTADAVFILANKFSTNPHEEDAKAILNLLSLKHFAHDAAAGRDLPVFIQVFLPTSARHLEAVTEAHANNTVVCTQELKMRLIGAAVRCPGFSTILHNLVWSSAEEDEMPLPWMRQYGHGLSFEMYRLDLADAYRGLTFAAAAAAVYSEAGALLFALEIYDPRDPTVTTSVLLNPGRWVIPRDTAAACVRAYAITEDQAAAHFVGHAVRATNLSAVKLAAASKVLPTASDSLGLPSPPASAEGRSRAEVNDMLRGHTPQTGGGSAAADWAHVRQAAVRPFSEVVVENVQSCGRVVRDHVLVVGSVRYVHALLTALADPDSYIVVLHPTPPTEEEWSEMHDVPNLLFVKGSALNHFDLVRSGVLEASRGIILSKVRARRAGAVAASDETTLIDSEALFAFQAMETLNPRMHVVTELVANDSMRFLAPKRKTSYSEYVMSPHFAAGQVFSASMIDMVLVQAHFHPTIVNVVEALVDATGRKPAAVPPFVAWLGRMYPRFAGVRPSSLTVQPLPDGFVGRSYGELFAALAEGGSLPLGLLRAGGPHSGLGNDFFPFVYTNPLRDTQLRLGDAVYVFAESGFSLDDAMGGGGDQFLASFSFGSLLGGADDEEEKISGPPQDTSWQQRTMWADPALSLKTAAATPSPARTTSSAGPRNVGTAGSVGWGEFSGPSQRAVTAGRG